MQNHWICMPLELIQARISPAPTSSGLWQRVDWKLFHRHLFALGKIDRWGYLFSVFCHFGAGCDSFEILETKS